MPTLTRPGVYVDESAFPTYVSATPGTAAACFVGMCPRGPTTPTKVNSCEVLTGSDLKAANTFADPKKVLPQPLEAPTVGPRMTLQIPARSYTVVSLAT